MASTVESIGTSLQRRGGKALVYVANFGLAKGAAYLGPLLLAMLLAPEVYGAIEIALSIGLLAAPLLTFGIASAVPQLALVGRTVPVRDLLGATVAALGLALICIAGLSVLAGLPAIYALAALTTGLAVAQGALSSYCRTFSLRNAAVWADGLALLTATAAGVVATLAGRPDVATLAVLYAVVSVLVVAAAGRVASDAAVDDLNGRLRQAMTIGLPMLGFALVTIWLAVSGRILIGFFLSVDAVATYAFSFRVASVVVIVHSLLMTGLFARMYTMRTRAYDRQASIYLAAIAGISGALALVYPFALGLVETKAVRADQHALAVSIYPVVALQVFAWIASAALEVRINRARLAGRATVGSIAVAAVGLAAMAAIWQLGALSLRTAVLCLAAQMLAVAGIQLALLARRGLVMPRTAIAIGAGAAFLSALALAF
ncbi:MAG: hypothetical protein AB7E70_08805 [Hyphomicrobiaceae bacterium]